MSFDTLNLAKPILKAVSEAGYKEPSPIQSKAIPVILDGRDIMAAAQTGTGKTAGFTLPLLTNLLEGKRPSSNGVRALVLTPTRELAAQVHQNVVKYSANTNLKAEVVFGGVKINPQMMKLRGGVDVLVATPGRLLDLHSQNAVNFKQLEVLILDEADRMLDMGFIRDIRKILNLLPAKRQSLLFSATFSEDIKALAKSFLNNPAEVSVNPANATAKTVEQIVVPVDKKKKGKLLSYLIKENDWQQVLVFTRTKHGANRLTRQLEADGLSAAAIHGNKSQGARTKALANFKAGEVRILVATDIAARGIDIAELPQVVNFDLPNVAEDYVHRIGRSGRAGKSGFAASLVCADEIKELQDIEYVIQKHIDRKVEPGFEPANELPPSRAIRPLKAKKPKKPKKPKEAKVEHKDGQRSGDKARGNNKQPNTGDKKGNTQKKWHKPNRTKNNHKRGGKVDPYAATR